MDSQSYEQMMNIYHNIFAFCGVSAVFCLIVAAVLFVVLRIANVFSELTGRGAKKAIEAMIKENTQLDTVVTEKMEVLDQQDMAITVQTDINAEFVILRSIVEIHTDKVL